MGLFKVLESPLDITTTTIIRRIVSNHEAYQVHLPPYHYFLLTNHGDYFTLESDDVNSG